jgi:DNA-binding NtrC family response regulator
MTKKEGHILIIDDDPEVLLSAELLLEDYFQNVQTLAEPSSLESFLQSDPPDVILLDMNFTRGKTDGREGLGILDKIRTRAWQVSVVLITAYGDIDLAVEATKKGAFDFVLKPWKNAKLLATALSAYKYAQSLQQNKRLKSTQRRLQDDSYQEFEKLVGRSPAMEQLRGTIARVGPTQANLLITGENGTGKELVARQVHQQSERREEVFLPVDLGALNENLFESELFGYVKGAFTDAREDKPGRFELANGGTVFLDEIGNLPPTLQSKLLTVLQSRRINRVGSANNIPVDFRLVAATNSDLEKMIEEGTFREDLYYRINTIEIRIPPLRERKEDIPELTDFFLEKLSKKYGKQGLKPSRRMMQQLEKHDWPGNIRELVNTLERAVILSEKNTLDVHSVHKTPCRSTGSQENLNLAENEKQLILKALNKNNGNITRAAEELGIRRNALYRRLNKYGI